MGQEYRCRDCGVRYEIDLGGLIQCPYCDSRERSRVGSVRGVPKTFRDACDEDRKLALEAGLEPITLTVGPTNLPGKYRVVDLETGEVWALTQTGWAPAFDIDVEYLGDG